MSWSALQTPPSVIQNIYLGPNLPAFITPNVLNVLVENFKIHPTNDLDFKSDMKQMLGR